MKNKKGIGLLGNHTANLIIAVLAVLVLVYLGYKVFGLFQGESDLEKAENYLEEISLKISNLEIGKETNYMILSLKDWYFKAYNKGFYSSKICDSDNCLCFCDKEDCSEIKKCKEIDLNVIINISYIEYETDSVIGYIGEEEKYVDFIEINEIPYKFKIIKEIDGIKIKNEK